MIEDINKRERNTEARKQVNKISKEYGVSFSFLARQMDVKVPNFNHWKKGSYEYGVDRLNQVEAIIEKYRFSN